LSIIFDQLGISIGMPEPHGFAVHSNRHSSVGDLRPSHPAPNVRDDRETPLLIGRETRKEQPLICPTAQADFLGRP
jgi:hypothetical protein